MRATVWKLLRNFALKELIFGKKDRGHQYQTKISQQSKAFHMFLGVKGLDKSIKVIVAVKNLQPNDYQRLFCAADSLAHYLFEQDKFLFHVL